MKKISLVSFVSIFACLFLVNENALAWSYSLVQDLGVKGLVRYCKYNNDKIYTVNATNMCQISIEDSAPGFSKGTGFFSDEREDGMTKVCVYNVMGEKKFLRVSSTSICPLNANF